MNNLAQVLRSVVPQAYYVGGIVRNGLLKRESSDIDLALPPQEVAAAAKKLAKALNAAVFEMDAEFGVWRLVTHRDKIQIDLTAFQGDNLKADLLRRDFAFNALAYPVTSPVKVRVRPQKNHNAQVLLQQLRKADIIDYTQGVKDVEDRLIDRTHPRVFREDPLRMLRAFRMAAELKFTISSRTLQQIKKDAPLIVQAAGERVHEELVRLFATSCAYEKISQMDACGLLTALFPELEAQRACAEVYYGKGGVLTHTLLVFKRMEYLLDHLPKAFARHAKQLAVYGTQKPLFKMAALLHDVAKPSTAKEVKGRLRFFYHEQKGADMARRILERLHYSRAEIRLICAMIGAHLRPSNLASNDVITDRGAYHFFRDMGEAALPLLLLCWADYTSYISDSQLRRILPKSNEPMMTLAQAQKKQNVGKTLRHLQVLSLLLRKFFEHPQVVRPERLLSGKEVMEILHLPSGPLIGRALEALAEAQVEGKVKDRTDAAAFLKTLQLDADTTQK